MATQALVENLQREGLTDIEKADGIAQLAGMFSLRDGIENCTRLLGFSRDAIGQFLRIARLEPKTKNAAAKARLSRSAIDRAQAIGSDAMVKTAAEQKLSSSALEGIASALHSATNTKVRSKITEQVVAGKITTPEKAKAAVRREAAKAAPKNRLQPDLHNVLLEWTRFIRQWRQELQAVESFREYIDTDPDVATMFRKEVSALIRDLRKLE